MKQSLNTLIFGNPCIYIRPFTFVRLHSISSIAAKYEVNHIWGKFTEAVRRPIGTFHQAGFISTFTSRARSTLRVWQALLKPSLSSDVSANERARR